MDVHICHSVSFSHFNIGVIEGDTQVYTDGFQGC